MNHSSSKPYWSILVVTFSPLPQTAIGLGFVRGPETRAFEDEKRVLQGGSASGSSDVIGTATGARSAGSMNTADDPGPLVALSNGVGTGTISSNVGSQGFALVNSGQAQGTSSAAISGDSSGVGSTGLNALDDGINAADSAGSVVSSGTGCFYGKLQPSRFDFCNGIGKW